MKKYSNDTILLESLNLEITPYEVKKSKYKYDLNGAKTDEIYYDEIGHIKYHHNYEYKYDSKGNWIEKIHFYNGKPSSIIERKIKYYE